MASKRNGAKDSDSGDSHEEGYIDRDSIKQQVEEAVGSLERRHKSSSRRQRKQESSEHRDDSLDAVSSKEAKGNDNWDAFQSLLLKDKDSDNVGLEPLPVQEESDRFSTPLNMESEAVRKRQPPSDDSFLVVNGNTEKSDLTHAENFEAGVHVRPIRRENTDEEMLFSQRPADSGGYSQADMSQYAGSRMIRSQTEGDWFLHNQADPTANQEDGSGLIKTFVGDPFSGKKNEKDVITDDSFMIQSRVDQSESQTRTTDIMVSDIVGVMQHENSAPETTNDKPVATHEPDDLFMFLGREPGAETVTVSWTPEIDYENDLLANEASKISAETKASEGKDKKSAASRGKLTGKDAKSRASNRPDPTLKAKRPPWGSRAAGPNSKSEREEERRKRMEELLIQRQKRIAGRSSGSGSSSSASKKTPTMAKTVKKDEKTTSAPAQTKPKPVLRSSTIERLAVARTAPKEHLEPSPQSKSAHQKPAIKRTSAAPKPAADKTNKTQEKKLSSDKNPIVSKKDKSSATKSPSLSREPSTEIKENTEVYGAKFPSESPEKQANAPPATSVDEFKDIKELHSVSSSATTKEKTGSHDNASDVMNWDVKPVKDHSKSQAQMIDDNETEKKSMPICEDKELTRENQSEDVAEVKFPSKLASPKKSVTFSETNMEEKFFLSPRVSEIDISTPPPPPSESIQSDHTRKKWNSEETSPKTAKVFRKLLMFGRKGRS